MYIFPDDVRRACESLPPAYCQQIGRDLARGFYSYKPASLESACFRVRDGGRSVECETPEEWRRYWENRAGEPD